jgi:hypothetical protein
MLKDLTLFVYQLTTKSIKKTCLKFWVGRPEEKKANRESGRRMQDNLTPPLGQQPPVCQTHLTIEASRSYSDTPHALGLLCTNDQPEAQTSIWQHTIVTTDNTTIPPAGYEHTIPTNERPQKHVLDGAATGIGRLEGNIKLNLQKEEKMDLIGLEQCPMAGSCLCGNTGTSPDICNLPIRC